MTEYDPSAPPPPGERSTYAQPVYGRPSGRSARPRREAQLRSVRGLGIALQVLLGAQVIASVLGIVATVNEQSSIDRFLADQTAVSLDDLEGADDLASSAGLLQALLYLATAVVWIVWLWRARTNVDVWAPGEQRLGAGWAIGGWFIPVANLVLPVMVTRDTGIGTEHDRELVWQKRGYPLAVVWGVAFAVMNIVASIAYAKSPDIDPTAELNIVIDPTYWKWEVADYAVTILAAVVAVTLVRSLTERQTDRLIQRGRWAEPGVSAPAD